MKHLHWSGLLVCIASVACASTGQQQQVAGSTAGCQRLDSQQALSAFYEPGNTYAATQVKEKVFLARALQPERTAGATLFVRAQPGVTGEYLQRALSCHAAKGEALSPNDPLHPQSGSIAELSVKPAGGSYAVRVVGDNTSSSREIWQRAQVFAGPGGSVSVEQVSNADASTTARF